MGPKKKGKGKKKGDEKVTRSGFLRTVEEKNAILAQERREVKLLEDEYLATEKKFEQLQEDMADIIQYLEHEIREKEKEIDNFETKIQGRQKELNDQDTHYKKIFQSMDDEYEAMKHTLMEQHNIINSRLNALDEIRQQREDFLQKQKILDEKLEELKSVHRGEIYEAEKKAIIAKDKLQKELDEKLERLSADFREATDVRIGAAIKKILKQNISLNNKMTCLQEVMKKIRKSYERAKEMENKTVLGLKEEECDLSLRKCEEQIEEIEEFLDNYHHLKEKIENFKGLNKQNVKLEKKILEIDEEIKIAQNGLKELEKDLDKKHEISYAAKTNLNNLKNSVTKVETVLYEAGIKAKQALEVESLANEVAEEKEAEEEEHGPMTQFQFEEFMENLKELYLKKREDLLDEVVALLSENLNHEELVITAASSEFFDSNLNFLERIQSAMLDRSRQAMSVQNVMSDMTQISKSMHQF